MDVGSILSSPVIWCVTVATAIYFFYWYGTSTFDYFTSQGISGPKPKPYVGSVWGIWRENIPRYDREIMKNYGKNVGYFDGAQPVLWTTDIDIIKSVFIKDFDHFVNRRQFDSDVKYLSKMLFVIKDQEWKDVRSAVTPVFTSGKIKRMSTLIKECTDRLATKFEGIASGEGKIDAKSELSVFTMDVIARCVFGLTLKNLGDESDPFMEHARKAFNPPAFKSPIVLLSFLSPLLVKILSAKLFAKGFEYFFRILEDLINERANSSEKYHDFVEVAREAISEITIDVDGVTKPKWTKEEVDEIVIAQSAVFLLAGFDTTGTTLTNVLFQMARNPEIQERLYEQIKQRLETHGEVKHEMVLNFPYMDHVINETLRMYPAVPRVERQCSKDITYNGINIKKGVIVVVPIFALHYDKDYYPDPETFNPDRWDTDSPIKPNANAFMPFGIGPRNCVGMRFAMEEMKIALCTLISRFRFFPVEETPERIEFEDGPSSVTQPLPAKIGLASRT